jgi:hypothetical protein
MAGEYVFLVAILAIFVAFVGSGNFVSAGRTASSEQLLQQQQQQQQQWQ